jgi:arylsulfatase A-like enzyme
VAGPSSGVRPLKFLFLLALTAVGAACATPERHVVLITWDGMRPDFISPTDTPNLWRLRERGVFFAHHHPVYLSATEVNGTAMATGAYPEHSTVIANTDYRPLIDPVNSIGIEVPRNVRKGDAVSNGHYLARPTVAELLHAHGMTTAIAGSKQVALLHDRAEREDDGAPIVFEGDTLPPSLKAQLVARDGAFPKIPADENKRDRDAWTTRVLIHDLWRDGVPAYSLLWLGEPDASQHATGPGSPQSLAGIKSDDDHLGEVVAELERRGLLDQTDILVVSDHGFSTISRKVDVAEQLRSRGIKAVRKTSGQLQPGEVMSVSNGGSTLFYVADHDPALTHKLVETLQGEDWASVLFTRDGLPGTFRLEEARIASPLAPDVVLSLRWSPDLSPNGTPGLQTSDLSPTTKKMGNHASLSPYDMHNTLVVAGPDFRKGVVDTLPSANTDVAPTILWCLALKEETKHMDGRPLAEALTIEAPALRSYEIKRLTAEAPTPAGTWKQYLQVSEVNGVRYLDQGEGGVVTPK